MRRVNTRRKQAVERASEIAAMEKPWRKCSGKLVLNGIIDIL
jgi:hypothetical protein